MRDIGAIVGGKYRILDHVGSGGTSHVYLAEDLQTGERWALKEFSSDTQLDSQIIHASLAAETHMLIRLRHPNLPQIVDVVDDGDSFIIVREFIEGETLTDYLEYYGALPEADVVRWAMELSSALSYLHSQEPPIIYRDMKPDNVIIRPDGSAALFDFGAAREYKLGAEGDTVSLGTQGYAAPEQFGGWGQSDGRTDIYSLGVTLYHLVTGHNPAAPPYRLFPIRELNPGLSEEMEQIILRCTEIDPKNRYQTCDELTRDLEELYAFLPPAEYQEPEPQKSFPWPLLLAALVILLVVGATAFAIRDVSSGGDRDTVQDAWFSASEVDWADVEEAVTYSEPEPAEPETAEPEETASQEPAEEEPEQEEAPQETRNTFLGGGGGRVSSIIKVGDLDSIGSSGGAAPANINPDGRSDGDTVLILDSALDEAVRSACGVRGRPLTYRDVKNIAALDLTNKGIRELNGIEYLTGLRMLELYGNRVSDLTPLSKLTGLTALGLYNNNVSDLSPLSGLTELTILILSDNSVTDVRPLAYLTQLERLQLNNNRISDISPLWYLTNLETLQLMNNDVTDLTALSSMTRLSYLDLDGNSISVVTPLTRLTGLEMLYIEVTDVDACLGDLLAVYNYNPIQYMFVNGLSFPDSYI